MNELSHKHTPVRKKKLNAAANECGSVMTKDKRIQNQNTTKFYTPQTKLITAKKTPTTLKIETNVNALQK